MERRGQRNLYTCDKCGRRIVTENAIDLVTPFLVRCRATEGCEGSMSSGFYPSALNGPGRHRWPVTHRWIPYTAEEIEEFRNDGDAEMLEWATGEHGRLVEVES